MDQWYLGIYLDAIEWVEITNTRGMSQFADGGIVGTKPYAASANYMKKMGPYCSGCSYDAADKTGANSCPSQQFVLAFPRPQPGQARAQPADWHGLPHLGQDAR